jgi:thymidylate kinase
MNGVMDNESVRAGRQSGFHRALDSLRQPGIVFSLRKATADAELPMEGELDIWLDPRSIPAADAALARAGFHYFSAPGQGRHRFYLSFEEGRWFKLDAKLRKEDGSETDRAGLAGPRERLRARLGRRRLAGIRRRGPVVAVLGPDGAGKGSVVASLQRSIPVAVTAVYLGFGRSRSPEPREPSTPGEVTPSRPGAILETAFILRKAIRCWKRLLPAYLAAWRGHIVLCDRHPIEVLAVRPDRTKPARAIERFIASRLVPRPDATILLDAPGEILFRRKGEHPVEVLERWRRSYAEVFVPLGATVVATTGPPRAAVAQASEVVWRALRRRRGW